MENTTHKAGVPVRVVLAKVGLDGHDRGIKVVARALRDAGFHVIYAGLWQTPEAVVRTVADEDADWLGLSLLSGAHMTLVPRVLQLLRDAGLGHVGVFCRDLDTMESFYRDFLGLTVTKKRPGAMVFLSSDPARSVLNEYNQCWDVPNLFVTDASCYVSAGVVGPTLTIMALTARACEHIAKEHAGGALVRST